MLRLPTCVLSLATLLGVAVPASAQIDLRAVLGKHVRVAARIGSECAPPRRVPRCLPPPCEPIHREPVRCEPRPRGHWETVCEQVWVPGCHREEHVPAVWGWITDHCGHRHWGIVQPEHCRQVWVPGHFETRHHQVWVEDRCRH